MTTVKELIKEINMNRNPENNKTTYDTKSRKDELIVMRAMMNDKTYKVDVYGPNGIEETICPSEIFRNTISSIISGTTGISQTESNHLIDNYEFKNNEAKGMIAFSKEFVNTYLQTGRKLPLGGREKSNVSLLKKTIPAGLVKYPVKVGEDEDGRNICRSEQVFVEQYDSIKIFAPCPEWVKNKNK